MPPPTEPAGSEGPPEPPSQSPVESPPRRVLRHRPEKRGRPSLPDGAQIVYRIGRSILRCDRDDLEDTLHQFHANPDIQNECQDVLGNAQQFLTEKYLTTKGNHYVAKCDIPAGVRVAFYSGFIERADARHSRNHEMQLGAGLRFEATIDGSPGLWLADDARPGRLQIVNHCCRPGNNCVCVSVVCTSTFLPLHVLVTKQNIEAGTELTFPYQEPCFKKGVPFIARNAFWQDASSLTSVPRGMEVVHCSCQRPCPNGWGRLEKRRPHPPLPPPPPPPPPLSPPPCFMHCLLPSWTLFRPALHP